MLIEQDRMSVECFRRDEQDRWVLQAYGPGDRVELSSLDFSAVIRCATGRCASERAKARAVLPQETALSFPLPVFEVMLMGRSPHLRGVESTRDRDIAREALRLVVADC